jgi:hypothetical protein
MRRAVARVPAIVLLAAAVMGCGANVAPSRSSSADPGSVGSSPRATAASLPVSSATASATPIVPESSAPSIVVDPSLVEILPATLAGLDRQVDSTVDAEAFADPSLARIASAAASALYVDPASGDFAYATIIRLREPAIDETSFRAYRDSFDKGACSQAGGVTGNAEAQLGGRTTHIGACGGGVFTYHAFLAADRSILSISSAGAKRLGEQLAAAVTG